MKNGDSPHFQAMELFRLDGRVALVTGGAGLYGTPISRALGQAGAKVIIASRDRDKCEARAEELRGEGLDCRGEVLDQGDVESIRGLRDRIESAQGPLDVLINNAVCRTPTHYDEATPEQWAEALRVNITGVHFCTLHFSEGMRRRGQGSIVNIASIYGVVAPKFSIYEGLEFSSPPSYAFEKGGLIAYTRYCASLFAAEGVRVNCVSPGGYYSGQSDVFVDRYDARVPLGRMAGDADILGPIIFFASEASRYVTGVNLLVDGGLTIR